MSRTIKIEGVGQASVKPDYVLLLLIIESIMTEHLDAVDESAKKVKNLENALVNAGLEKEMVKTVGYNVRPNYVFSKNQEGLLQNNVEGYECIHRIKIEFDYDSELLSKVLGAITESQANPQLDFSYTVKDKEAVKDELYRKMAADARRKAEILCVAAGASLGKLISIDCGWSGMNLYASPRLNMGAVPEPSTQQMNLQPEDVNIRDSASFVWEIE